MKALNVHRGSTLLLRGAVVVLGLFVLFLCGLILPAIATGWTQEYPSLAALQYPVLVWLSLTTIPFYAALYQSMKLLGYIDKGTAFSQLSVTALGRIKICGAMLGLLYAAGLPFVYEIAQFEDAPGLIVIGMMISFAGFAVGIFAAVLERLLADAVAIKSENDLTV